MRFVRMWVGNALEECSAPSPGVRPKPSRRSTGRNGSAVKVSIRVQQTIRKRDDCCVSLRNFSEWLSIFPNIDALHT
jgi:hypothetical protein